MDRQDRWDGEQAEEAEGISEHESGAWPTVDRLAALRLEFNCRPINNLFSQPVFKGRRVRCSG